MPKHVTCIYVRQAEALGLGHAVLCAQAVVGDEPFAVILADDLIDAAPGVTRQLVDTYERHGCSVLAVEDVHVVGGFARAGWLSAGEFASAGAEP